MLRASLCLALAACTSIPPSGHPFSPTSRAPTAAAPSAPLGPQGDGSAFGDERTDEAAEGSEGGSRRDEGADPTAADPGVSPDDTLAAMARFARTPPAAGTGSPAVAPLPATPAPVWDPSRPLPDASFGVRVLGVLLDLNPPRAVLGLPDGREQVVTPGAMLPAEGIVVLAIGRDAVQIARITPQGFYARVETDTVASLAPGR